MSAGIAARSPDTTTRLILIIVVALLTTIFWGNVFRFTPRLIDEGYDATSEGVVIGRMARSAADGFLSQNADLGINLDPAGTGVTDLAQHDEQKRYFEDPRLVNELHLVWWPYASQFGLQGMVLSAVELINPLPRKWRIGFYHLLASLFCAGAVVWVAEILRRRFGWAAFCGFLIPIAFEPMFTALAPNLYWLVGGWFVPMAIAMLLADEEDARRRHYLVAAAFVFFLLKCLCGYEFISTVILAAAVGCLLGIRERPEGLTRILASVVWITGAGVAGFAAAVLAHAAKEGGFAIILRRAAVRIAGEARGLQDEIILGKFATIQSVLLRYLEGNGVTLSSNFAIPLAVFTLVAVLSLLDKKIVWYLGEDRRQLQICALAFLASIPAPLSWFVLAKGHSFVHTPINFILWYVPTFPLGGAVVGLALRQTFEQRRLWAAADAARRAVTIAIPALVVLTIAAIYFSDRRIQTEGAWVLSEHAKGWRLFESEALGIELAMTDQWFTIRYDCRAAASSDSFFIDAYEGRVPTRFSFSFRDRPIYVTKNRCFSAQAKSNRPYHLILFGATSNETVLWRNEAVLPIPDSMTLEQLTDAEWDHGILRSTGTELLLRADSFARLFLRTGDRLRFASSAQRTITAIATVAPFKWVSVDAPVKPADIGDVPIKIIRQ